MNEFASTVERYRQELLVHCYRMLGSLPDAEDAVQETLLRAWRYRDSLKEGAPLRPRLHRVATNACLDAIARDERRAVLAARAAEQDDWTGQSGDVVWLGPIPNSVLEPTTPPAPTLEAMTVRWKTSTGASALPSPTKRCMSTSTSSSRQSAPTSTGEGCTRRWSTGRPHTRFPTSRSLCSTGRGSGRRPRRSSLQNPRQAPQCATRIEREFDSDAVRRLKGDARHDITVNGPGLAAHPLGAGLVDELQMFVCPALVGGGKRFFPDGVRLKLELVDERRLRNGMVFLRYAVRGLIDTKDLL